MQIGVQRMNTNRQSEAMLIFNELIENFPDYAEAWNRRATLHYLLGNYQESIGDIEKVLALEPRHFGAMEGLGLIFINLQEYDQAIKIYKEMLKILPHDDRIKDTIIFLVI